MRDCRALYPHIFNISAYLDLFVGGRELPLLKDHDMVADPLEQKSHQLIIFLPAQLQLLQPTQQKKKARRLTTTDRKSLLLLRPRVHTPHQTQLGSNNPGFCVKGVAWKRGDNGERQTDMSVCPLSVWGYLTANMLGKFSLLH